MILTVTMNPSVDRLYHLQHFAPHTVMRVEKCLPTAGGKGLNVARVALALGEKVTATGILGGHNGEAFRALLQPDIVPAFTNAAGETRNCINIRDGEGGHTELLEPGAPVSDAELAAFLAQYEALLPQCDVVTLSGSLPKGCPPDWYARLIEQAKAYHKQVLLDTSGAALQASVAAKPTMVKPNADEIAQLTGMPAENLRAVALAAKALCEQGIEMVVVSLGKQGAIAACDGQLLRAQTPDIAVVNTVGCGDSMLAGFAVGCARGASPQQRLRIGMAAATANAMTESTGFVRRADYETLLPQIVITPCTEDQL